MFEISLENLYVEIVAHPRALSWCVYSLNSPFGHLYNTDTSLLRTVRLVPEMPKMIHSLPL